MTLLPKTLTKTRTNILASLLAFGLASSATAVRRGTDPRY